MIAEERVVKEQYGGKEVNPKLMTPQPNTTYLVYPNPTQAAAGISFEHKFRINGHGFVESAYVGDVQFFQEPDAGVRNSRKLPGRPTGTYHRGHIISAELGAGMEAINLLWMPSAINQKVKPETARKQGHAEIANHMERFHDDEHDSGGTLSQTGEFYLSNYRIFEEQVKKMHKEKQSGQSISVLIQPATFRHDGRPLTDILHTTIFVDDIPLYRYKITSEISS